MTHRIRPTHTLGLLWTSDQPVADASKGYNIYKKNKTLSFVLYGCETWSLTLSEEYRLRVFDNRVLRT
jgi:hypothetical protein